MRRQGLLPVLLLLWGVAVVGLFGCSNDPEECLRECDGDFFFVTDPGLPAPDSLSNVNATLTGATLVDIEDFSTFPGDPKVNYVFSVPGRGRVDINMNYIGWTLPVEIGQTYTLFVERTQGLVPAAMALMISDDQGMRFLGVNDWRPNTDSQENPRRYRVFAGGDTYSDLNGDGDLRVFLGGGGCEPRVVNSTCFLEITNLQLTFVVGSTQQLRLWNRDTGRLGNWVFHVHKAERVVGKSNCDEGLQGQNGMSFFVERDGLR